LKDTGLLNASVQLTVHKQCTAVCIVHREACAREVFFCTELH